MAMCGLHSLTGEAVYRTEAVEMMERILNWTGAGAAELGRPQLSGDAGGSSLAVPMCLLSLLSMMRDLGWDRPGLEEASVAEVLSHVVGGEEGKVLETVGAQGQQLPGAAGIVRFLVFAKNSRDYDDVGGASTPETSVDDGKGSGDSLPPGGRGRE